MKKLITFCVSALSVWFPSVAWVIIETYLLNHHDIKLGDKERIVDAAYLFGVPALIAGTMAVLTHVIFLNFEKRIGTLRIVFVAIIGGFTLSVAIFTIKRPIPFFETIVGEMGGILLSWAAMCLFVFMFWKFIDYQVQNNKALKRDVAQNRHAP